MTAIERAPIERSVFAGPNDTVRPLSDIWPISPGEYETDCHGLDEPKENWFLKLETDGVGWGWDDKIAMLWYYADGAFVEFPLQVC